ncbi:MAG: NifB/NifX family molybdenum-iron cluster-binding protein [Mangrovibacterium sp.]
MKIAIPAKENKVDNHFGHCDHFMIFKLNDQLEVVSTSRLETDKTCGCKSNLADELAAQGVGLLLAGGIGEGAIKKLNQQKIDVIAGFKGDIETVIEQWKRKDYLTNFSICTEHDSCSH